MCFADGKVYWSNKSYLNMKNFIFKHEKLKKKRSKVTKQFLIYQCLNFIFLLSCFVMPVRPQRAWSCSEPTAPSGWLQSFPFWLSLCAASAQAGMFLFGFQLWVTLTMEDLCLVSASAEPGFSTSWGETHHLRTQGSRCCLHVSFWNFTTNIVELCFFW